MDVVVTRNGDGAVTSRANVGKACKGTNPTTNPPESGGGGGQGGGGEGEPDEEPEE